MRLTTALILLFTASSLSACGGLDDVEVALPFVGNILAKSKSKEAKMANRNGLVLPPAVQGLPTPTEKGKSANADASWPIDPDLKTVSDKELAALEEKKYRRDGDWSGKRSSGNGTEDFNNKIEWIRRQKGVLSSTINSTVGQE